MSRVLIVDDAAFIRMTLKSMIEKNGFEVVGEAENGEVAVNKYVELKPDLVTMDITMPVKNGIDALESIMEIDPKAKVIMASALGQEAYIQKAVEMGAKYFIVKPFNENQVIEVLNKVQAI